MPEFTPYARERMKIRKLSDNDVEYALFHRVAPDSIGQRSGRREILGLGPSGVVIRVIVNEENEVINALRES